MSHSRCRLLTPLLPVVDAEFLEPEAYVKHFFLLEDFFEGEVAFVGCAAIWG